MDDFNDDKSEPIKNDCITSRHIQELKKIAAEMSTVMADHKRYSTQMNLRFQKFALDSEWDGKTLKLGGRVISIEQVKHGYFQIKKLITKLEMDIEEGR